MSWVAAAVAGGAIVGGVISAGGARSAAQTQAAAGEAAIAEQAREFDIAQKNLQPYLESGQTALSELNKEMAPGGQLNTPFNFDITQDPGYQFRLNQGLQGVTNSAAAAGTNLSGATLKELTQYGQQYASGEYNQAFSRNLQTTNQRFGQLSAVAGMGLGATQTGVQAGAQNAASIGNTITGIGNAQAAGQVGTANAIGGAFSGAGNAFLLSSLMNKTNPNAAASTGGALDQSLVGQGAG